MLSSFFLFIRCARPIATGSLLLFSDLIEVELPFRFRAGIVSRFGFGEGLLRSGLAHRLRVPTLGDFLHLLSTFQKDHTKKEYTMQARLLAD